LDYFAGYDSPVGQLLLQSDGVALTGLYMGRKLPPERTDLPVFQQTAAWLDAYFRGQRIPMDVPVKLEGTAFQKRVWEILLTIPFGETRTYGSIARQLAGELGKERMSAQAVGQAVGKNPVSILIPCHRVIGSSGKLTGYAGGLENKRWLLRHEGWGRGQE
jgi:O-6-methylguanine DNA methyltransferase